MTTVFTNGIFDILHVGHIRLLKFARTYGSKLIVGLNSDESAARLKGNTRPIISMYDRIEMLVSFPFISQVMPFEEDTPERLIKDIKPDILVKGPEALKSKIPGAEFVESYGGKVIVPDWEIQESTSKIVDRVLSCERPIPHNLRLVVDGLEIRADELSLYGVRFTTAPDGSRPVLYRCAKRVIEPWSLEIKHNQPEDKDGKSA